MYVYRQIESFQMRKETFNELWFLLQPALEPKPVMLKSREPLSVEKKVAVALYKLASCVEYRVVGNVFGIHKSTVKKCLYKVVNAINELMMKDYFQMPNTEAAEIAMNFEKISHIPQIIGCIDGSHISILAPTEGYRDFVNRKGWPSYILQAVVDDKTGLEIFVFVILGALMMLLFLKIRVYIKILKILFHRLQEILVA
ncbi:protein ALP1-like [Harpegnathos saltator]|uniref:protein ALP1-like n=1 Tax=Harpegnathos saltator TaxID=610380 RepID=UPI000DBED99E|nr:protein ALP1-like [Harpegnathos saltator]XP_025157692.1 protein ALP1-like [Harpegnathos saltator]